MALFYRENDDKPWDLGLSYFQTKTHIFVQALKPSILGWYTMNVSRSPHGIVPTQIFFKRDGQHSRTT